MQKNTKKRGAILSAVVMAVFFAAYMGLVLFGAVSESYGDAIGMTVLAVFALVIAAVIWGIFAALRQRLQEIDKGEEEDASKY